MAATVLDGTRNYWEFLAPPQRCVIKILANNGLCRVANIPKCLIGFGCAVCHVQALLHSLNQGQFFVRGRTCGGHPCLLFTLELDTSSAASNIHRSVYHIRCPHHAPLFRRWCQGRTIYDLPRHSEAEGTRTNPLVLAGEQSMMALGKDARRERFDAPAGSKTRFVLP